MIKCFGCSCRGRRFNSQHLRGSPASATLVTGAPPPSSARIQASLKHCMHIVHGHARRQGTHTEKMRIKFISKVLLSEAGPHTDQTEPFLCGDHVKCDLTTFCYFYHTKSLLCVLLSHLMSMTISKNFLLSVEKEGSDLLLLTSSLYKHGCPSWKLQPVFEDRLCGSAIQFSPEFLGNCFCSSVK